MIDCCHLGTVSCPTMTKFYQYHPVNLALLDLKVKRKLFRFSLSRCFVEQYWVILTVVLCCVDTDNRSCDRLESMLAFPGEQLFKTVSWSAVALLTTDSSYVTARVRLLSHLPRHDNEQRVSCFLTVWHWNCDMSNYRPCCSTLPHALYSLLASQFIVAEDAR